MNLEQFSSLRQHRLLATLDEQQFARIAAASHCIELSAEQMLFQRGAAARHFYIVMAGQMRLSLQSRSGHEKIVELLGPGQAFAEALMFSESPAFPVTSIAVMPTTLAAIPNADYLGILRASTETCLRMLADEAAELHLDDTLRALREAIEVCQSERDKVDPIDEAHICAPRDAILH